MRDQIAGIHLIPGDESIIRPSRTGLMTRLRARLRGRSLDRALAAGEDPASSPALAHRAASLTTLKNRRSLAHSLRRVLQPPHTRGGLSSAVAPEWNQLSDARLPLARVAAQLESDEPVYSRGVAMVQLLLTYGDSPLYVSEEEGDLRRAAEQIIDALEGREETW